MKAIEGPIFTYHPKLDTVTVDTFPRTMRVTAMFLEHARQERGWFAWQDEAAQWAQRGVRFSFRAANGAATYELTSFDPYTGIWCAVLADTDEDFTGEAAWLAEANRFPRHRVRSKQRVA